MSMHVVETSTAEQQELPVSFGFFNGKGGVGKTSCAANCGGLLAAAGYRVLIGDFDPQGNLCRDLGYDKRDGSELFTALLQGSAPPIVHNVGGRENLDVVPGGPAMFDLAASWFPASSVRVVSGSDSSFAPCSCRLRITMT